MENETTVEELRVGQMALPMFYEEIGQSVSRNTARELNRKNGGKSGRETLRIDVNKIIIREGFNWRIKPEGMSMEQWLYDATQLGCQELGYGIMQSNGSHDPIHVDLLEDGNYYLTEGFRRVMATRWLLEQGHEEFPDGSPLNLIESFINPKETTELERTLNVFRSQDNLKLKGIELALGLLRTKKKYNMTNQQIADELGKSRQWVDNKIGLAEEPEEIQQAIISGDLRETVATQLKHKIKDPEERVKIVKDSIDMETKLKVEDVTRKPSAQPRVREMTEEQLLINCSEEKQKAAMDVSEGISMIDKMRKHWKGLPPQTQDDLNKIADDIINYKLIPAREFIVSAADKR